MRKLASVQRIIGIEPILGADKIEMAKVLNWHCIVKKGEFNVGDYVVYFETDAIPPDLPDFDFLRGKHNKVKPIKARRIRGMVSQGLVMPIGIIEGLDISEPYGVEKYDPVEIVTTNGMVSGKRPEFIIKSDETRVQAYSDEIFNLLQGNSFDVTEKIDGTAFTCYIKDDRIGMCSRNSMISLETTSPFTYVYKFYDLGNRMRQLRLKYGYDIAIQGELIGRGIQGNKYGLKDFDVYLYNVIRLDTQEQFGLMDTNGINDTAGMLGIKTVPYLGDILMNNTVDDLVLRSSAMSLLKPDQPREGIVLRMRKLDLDRFQHKRYFNERVSFKVINPNFLCPGISE